MTQNNPLDSYRWKNRIILVFTDNDAMLIEQQKEFENLGREFEERDLLLFIINTQDGSSPDAFSEEEIEFLKSKYHIEKADFKVVLIGKDGGSKLSQEKPLSAQRLFSTIDTMPMRRQEMKKNKSDN